MDLKDCGDNRGFKVAGSLKIRIATNYSKKWLGIRVPTTHNNQFNRQPRLATGQVAALLAH
jgi:hypothetical protein